MVCKNKNLEEGRTKKGNVSCNASQSYPTTTQPKGTSHALQVHEDRIRPKTRRSMVWQTKELNRYAKVMFAPR